MTRAELAAAIRSLREDEKLDRRLDATSADQFVPWSEARARVLGSK